MNENPFSQPDEEPNPFAQPQPTVPEPALNPYAPTAFVSETEGFESDVEGYRRKYLAHEASIKSVGILYLIPGVIFFLLFLIGIAAFLMSMATGDFGGNEEAIFTVMMLIIYGAIGASQIYAGLGIRRFELVSRRILIVYSALGLIMFPLGTLINAYILYLLVSEKGKVVFSDTYQDVIRKTPHIKYKTSMIVKIFLVILVAVISLGVVALVIGG